MIKLNRIRNIFALTILLSPLFSSGAEELASEKEKFSSEWDTMKVFNLQKVGGGFGDPLAPAGYTTESCQLSRGKNSFFVGVTYDPDDPEKLGEKASDLIFEKLANLIMKDGNKDVDLEQEVKNYFRYAGNEISDSVSFGVSDPRVSFLLADTRDRDNFYVASVGARVMIIRNGKIIFATKKDHREFSNPEVFKHCIEAEDIVLGLTKVFEQLSDENIIKTLLENKFKLGALLAGMEGVDTKEAVLVRFLCCSSFGSNEAKG